MCLFTRDFRINLIRGFELELMLYFCWFDACDSIFRIWSFDSLSTGCLRLIWKKRSTWCSQVGWMPTLDLRKCVRKWDTWCSWSWSEFQVSIFKGSWSFERNLVREWENSLWTFWSQKFLSTPTNDENFSIYRVPGELYGLEPS